MRKVIQHIFPQNFAEALCYSLVHSLWEGLLLALLSGLIILLTRESHTASRYRLLAGALLIYAVTVCLTFMWIVSAMSEESVHAMAGVNADQRSNSTTALMIYFNDLLDWVQENARVIGCIWLLLVILQLGRLFFGLYTLGRLKWVQVKNGGKHWQEKTDRLRRALGIRQAVVLLESAIVKVPLVVGHLKPVLLVPAGLLHSQEPDHVDAILLHELAHIRRKDYLVNVLQTILEIFLFFSPVVLWLSWLIRTERENCCDDLVISQTKNKISYMKALVFFEEYRQGALLRKAVAFTGATDGLPGRLQRILASRNRSLGKVELILFMVILLFSALFITTNPPNKWSSLAKVPHLFARIAEKESEVNKALEAKKRAEAAAMEHTRHRESNP